MAAIQNRVALYAPSDMFDTRLAVQRVLRTIILEGYANDQIPRVNDQTSLILFRLTLPTHTSSFSRDFFFFVSTHVRPFRSA